ncbi:hypothetical protein HPB52_007731 [Rhipicephalus sanguineus]|uniref:Uncharacterized protein n=1 Tax=Rhipicephalus sanguineus TaxID=34632 RepID=A0A9D4PTA1_RHISA|nr:hypothetical protein HPB52_007731 [Rhipicephalus sanguineus]
MQVSRVLPAHLLRFQDPEVRCGAVLLLPSGAASSAEEVGGPRKAVGRHSARACPVRRGICLAAVAIRTPRPCTTSRRHVNERALCNSLVGFSESPPRRRGYRAALRLPPRALKGCSCHECRRSSGRWWWWPPWACLDAVLARAELFASGSHIDTLEA